MSTVKLTVKQLLYGRDLIIKEDHHVFRISYPKLTLGYRDLIQLLSAN